MGGQAKLYAAILLVDIGTLGLVAIELELYLCGIERRATLFWYNYTSGLCTIYSLAACYILGGEASQPHAPRATVLAKYRSCAGFEKPVTLS